MLLKCSSVDYYKKLLKNCQKSKKLLPKFLNIVIKNVNTIIDDDLIIIPNGKHIFHPNISVGIFGLPFEAFRLFQKILGRSSQNCLTIYMLTEISIGEW